MNYNVNPIIFSSTFAFPVDVADKYLKLCKAEHIKVLIYIMRNFSCKPSTKQIAAATDLTEFEVDEALLFWADTGIIVAENNISAAEDKVTVKKTLKPTRNDVAKRGLEDEKLRYLLSQTQMIFSRNLKGNEVETLGWLYDDLGLDVSVILYIVQYAKQQQKTNIRFIESIATDWADKGVETIADAEEQVKQLAVSEQAWRLVSTAFGLERRKPSKRESELSVKWVNEWKISREKLKEAYDICVDSKSKYSFSYIAKIIENWHNGSEKEKSSNKNSQNNITYDIDLYEKMVNSKD